MSDKVCVIGAGVSGLATIKALKDAGIAFDCFDVASAIGGLWKYKSDNGVAASYRGLHINTSKQMMPIAELQGKWVTRLVAGAVSLPDLDSIRQVIEKDKEAMARRYVNSTRHTIQGDYWPYIFELRKAVAGKLDRSKQVKA